MNIEKQFSSAMLRIQPNYGVCPFDRRCIIIQRRAPQREGREIVAVHFDPPAEKSFSYGRCKVGSLSAEAYTNTIKAATFFKQLRDEAVPRLVFTHPQPKVLELLFDKLWEERYMKVIADRLGTDPEKRVLSGFEAFTFGTPDGRPRQPFDPFEL